MRERYQRKSSPGPAVPPGNTTVHVTSSETHPESPHANIQVQYLAGDDAPKWNIPVT